MHYQGESGCEAPEAPRGGLRSSLRDGLCPGPGPTVALQTERTALPCALAQAAPHSPLSEQRDRGSLGLVALPGGCAGEAPVEGGWPPVLPLRSDLTFLSTLQLSRSCLCPACPEQKHKGRKSARASSSSFYFCSSLGRPCFRFPSDNYLPFRGLGNRKA